MTSRPSTSSLPSSLIVTVLSSIILLRILVGFQPHSGQDNFHGSKRAYGGDYEAQRHWMELTLHLPIGDWYWYDLEYWGLDYPPLTAYVSYVCGLLSSFFVGPETVALYDSRGIEDPVHKAYMRCTVLVLDLLIYVSAIWFITKRGNNAHHNTKSMWMVVLASLQPAIVLIDHGHFQYNSVSLGFALWSFFYMTKTNFGNCLVGGAFFCLALNFKQMILYYAPVVFFYLLGRCFADGTAMKTSTTRFVALGLTVIVVFVVHWWPFVWFSPADNDDVSASGRLLHVLHRIFPFQRGLFEGKVANLWCALSTKPFSIRKRLPESIQPLVAFGTTLLLIFPACYKLFNVGRSHDRRVKSSTNTKPADSSVIDYDWHMLLWGGTSTSLAFFLASFQVHEKSILMALAPVSLLLWEDFEFVNWFSLVCAWTLWPLIQVDRLEVAYFCTMTVYVTLVLLCKAEFKSYLLQQQRRSSSFFGQFVITNRIPSLCFLVLVILHTLEAFVTVPANLPDLFQVLWSISGCGLFCISYIASCWHLFSTTKVSGTYTKVKTR